MLGPPVHDPTVLLNVTPKSTWPDRAWQLAYRAGYPVMRAWWRIWPRDHHGALVAIRLGDKLLMVGCSYRAEWTFPGGGVAHGESSIQAATREVFEETGLRLRITGPPVVVVGHWEGRADTVHIFEIVLDSLPSLRLDNREVVAARLVEAGELAGMALTGPVLGYLDARRDCGLG